MEITAKFTETRSLKPTKYQEKLKKIKLSLKSKKKFFRRNRTCISSKFFLLFHVLSKYKPISRKLFKKNVKFETASLQYCMLEYHEWLDQLKV